MKSFVTPAWRRLKIFVREGKSGWLRTKEYDWMGEMLWKH
jgi:hypothetical protein